MTIAIVSPTNGASFPIGSNIALSVALENADSSDMRVTYYEGAKVRASATSPPFGAVWHASGLGEHAITAVVTDKAGNEATSESVFINIGPLNDNFDKAVVIKGKAPSLSGTTVGASLEPGEPSWWGGSVWYSWTAPVSGRLKMAMPNWPYGAFFGLYTGSTVSNLTLVANDWVGDGWDTVIDCAVQGGVAYKIVVAGMEGDLAHFAVKSSLTLAPSNDDFERRAVLPGYGGKATVYTFGASVQPGEPDGGYGASHRTVWWTWTAPVKGRISYNVESDFDSVIILYTGDSLTNLVGVGYGLGGVGPFDVAQGTTYQISVDGRFGQTGTAKLTATFNPAPPNDDFESSQIVSGEVTVLKGTSAGATAEPGEPLFAGGGSGYTVWYSWTAPASGYVTINPQKDTAEPVIAVYTGPSVSNLTSVAVGASGNVSFQAIEGTTYRISIDGQFGWEGAFDLQLIMSTVRLLHPLPEQNFPVGSKILMAAESTALDGSRSELEFILDSQLLGKVPRDKPAAYLVNAPLGSHTLVAAVPDSRVVHESPPVTFYVRPVNDAFVDRTVLPQMNVSVDGTTEAASFEPGEPPPADITARQDDASVWYSWTSPESGPARLSLTLGNLGVFSGETLTNLTFFPPDYWGARGVYQFQARAGTTYSIRVSGSYNLIPSDIGTFHLSLSQSSAPTNDDFTNRTTLAGYVASVTGDLYGSSTETDEPNAAWNEASVWYSWTAPGPGLLFVTNSAYTIAVFKGDSVSALTNVGPGPYRTLAGDTYQIQVSTTYHLGDSAPMLFDLGLTLWPPPVNDDYSQPIVLSGNSFSTNGYFAGATLQSGESAPPGANASVWYSWTAPASGAVTLTGSSGLPVSLTAYTGNSISNLSLIANSTEGWNIVYYFQLSFNAIGGTTYEFALFAPDDGTGLGTFQFSLAMAEVSPGPATGTGIVRALTPIRSALQNEASPPTLGKPAFQSPDHFQFELKGLSGSTYTVLTATNLSQPESTWEPLVSTNLPSDSVIIRIDRATNSLRFYRARQERW